MSQTDTPVSPYRGELLQRADTTPPSVEKPLDPCTLWQRVLHGVRRLYARADGSEFAGENWPDQIMHASLTDDFHAKQGRSTARWLLESAGKSLVVYLKRHYELPRWRGVMATI